MTRPGTSFRSLLATLLALSVLIPASGAPAAGAQDDGVWRIYTQANQVHDLAVENGFVWSATPGGAVRWDRADLSYLKYTSMNGLTENGVTAVAVDGLGNKWFGASNLTVSRFDGTVWTTFTADDGVIDARIRAIAADPDNHVWFATDAGVCEFDGIDWTTYTVDSTHNRLADDSVFDIAIDGDGDKWFATGAGVSVFDGTNWTTYNSTDHGLAGDKVRAIAIDGDEKWFGTWGDGVSLFHGSDWTTYNSTDHGLVDDRVVAIAIDSQGTKWFGT